MADISVTAGVTVPLDRTEDHHATHSAGAEEPTARLRPRARGSTPPSDVSKPEKPELARGSEPFTRVLSEDARTRRASEPHVEEQRYDLGDLIGRGGMGEVVAARDVQIGREVAIKRMRTDEPSEAALARFLREARIQGRLEHPAIPPVHELAHDAEGRPYFSMRKLEGVTLADTLRDPKSPFTRQRLLRAFVEICHAIDLAHSKRIVHRDLKPSNILLGRRGEVYVLDWGIARELDAPDAFSGIVLGTPGYMAPEQIRGEQDLDERVDIYALGCMLFEILTGRALHPRGDAGIEHALRGEFPYDADLPLELANACRRATQVHRTQRFASVSELGEIVQRFLDGDRDLEQRRALARHHLASARDAFLSQNNDNERRALVMREAGKALALDPTLDGAAELIGRLMLEPPAIKPAAVQRELAEHELRGAKLMSRVAIAVSLLYVAMLPAFILLGIRDVPYLCVYGGVAGVMLAVAVANRRFQRRSLIAAHIVTMMMMFALLAQMFSPVLISPALAAVTLLTISFNPLSSGKTSSIVTTLGMIVSVLGVWLLQWIDLLPSSVLRESNGLLLLTPVTGAAADFPATPVLAIIYVLVFVMAGCVGFFAQREIRQGREKLVVQAWHLRQLVQ